MNLEEQFGQIDIYLFDQMLRGRIRRGMRVLDAGCGGGRNLVYLLQEGFDVHASDADPMAVAHVRELCARLAPELPAHQRIREAFVERMPWDDASMDVVICNAVLHFARSDDQFDAMVRELWRVLAPGGLFFARLASSIGMAPSDLRATADGRFRLPDGSERYLVDEVRLMAATRELGGQLLDPLKTTVVQNQRCMTTWVLRKPDGSR